MLALASELDIVNEDTSEAECASWMSLSSRRGVVDTVGVADTLTEKLELAIDDMMIVPLKLNENPTIRNTWGGTPGDLLHFNAPTSPPLRVSVSTRASSAQLPIYSDQCDRGRNMRLRVMCAPPVSALLYRGDCSLSLSTLFAFLSKRTPRGDRNMTSYMYHGTRYVRP